MKYLILTLLLLPIVYFASKQKRWYLYLVFALIGILPEQLAFSIHEKLPLISATRILIVILLVFWIWDRWKTKSFSAPKSLLMYGLINIVISLINLRYGFGEINHIFLTVFERVLLVIMIKDMISNKDEFHTCLDFMIMGSMVLAVVGIFQSVFDYDIASVLHLQNTVSSVILGQRMGITRAFATFNAISYGCYCAFMLLLIYYRLCGGSKFWLRLAFATNFVAIICTFTRSAWIGLAAISFALLILHRSKLIKKTLSALVMTLIILFASCVMQPKLWSGLVETSKSAINTVLQVLPNTPQLNTPYDPSSPPDHTTPITPNNPDKPGFDLSEDFGNNANNPTGSRMMQWTAIKKMLLDGEALFGYGYNALLRGKLQFLYENWGSEWTTTTFLDVGLVALFTECGFVGGLSYLALLCYMFIMSLLKKSKNKQFDFYRLTILIIPLYLILNFLAAFLFYHIIWLYFGLFFTYQKINVHNDIDKTMPLPEE